MTIDPIPDEIAQIIAKTAKRLDRIYCSGYGNETDFIANRLRAAAYRAQAKFDARRTA